MMMSWITIWDGVNDREAHIEETSAKVGEEFRSPDIDGTTTHTRIKPISRFYYCASHYIFSLCYFVLESYLLITKSPD